MGTGGDAPASARPHRRWAFFLFALPIAAVVVSAVYNRIHPELAGIPFFVWYQFTAVVFGAAVTGVVYLLRGTEKRVRTTHLAENALSAEPPAPV